MKAITKLRREVGTVLQNESYVQEIIAEFQSILGESLAKGRLTSAFSETNGKYLLCSRGYPYTQWLAESGLVEKAITSSSSPWTLTRRGEEFYHQWQQGTNKKKIKNRVKKLLGKALGIEELVVQLASELQGTMLYNQMEEESPEQGRYRVEPSGLERTLVALGLATKRQGRPVLTRKAERLYRALEHEGYYDIKD